MSNWIDEIDLEKNTQFQVYICATFSHATKQLKITKSPTRENFEHREKVLGPGEKILGPRNSQEKIFWTHEISTRKNVGPKKDPWKYFRTHESTMVINETKNGTQPTIFSTIILQW